MKNRAVLGASIGLLIGLPWLALSTAGGLLAGFAPLPVALFERLAGALPGDLVTAALEAMIRALHVLALGPTAALGKALEFAMAYLLAAAILAALGALYAVSLARVRLSWPGRGLLAGLALGLLALPLAGFERGQGALAVAWSLAISLGWGLGLAWGHGRAVQTLAAGEDSARRRLLAQLLGGSLALGGLALGLGSWLSRGRGSGSPLAGQDASAPAGPALTPAPAGAGFTPVEGTRPEITPIEQFYRVDINLLPPTLEDFDEGGDLLSQRLRAQGGETDLPSVSYVLAVEGLVERPLTLDLAALQALPKVEVYATLECISNPIGGDLISTTLFEGARLRDVLEQAGLKAEAADIKFTCVDGYTESLPIESAMDPETLLCYAMGGQPLTREHGAPLRLYTPNRFGMKNPKWIVKIEAVDQDYFGYWEQRGWSEQAWVQITSVIDAALNPTGDRLEVGGIAYAGNRGIRRVEVRVGDGDWFPAQLKRPLSNLAWVIWRADLSLPPGRHRITVRAVDGAGEIQTAEVTGTHPNGATGYHSKDANVRR